MQTQPAAVSSPGPRRLFPHLPEAGFGHTFGSSNAQDECFVATPVSTDNTETEAGAIPGSMCDPERHRPALTRYFKRHWGRGPEAEDLVQEALLRLIRSPRPIDNEEAYVIRIAGNLIRDKLRREQSRQAKQHVPLEDNISFLATEEPGCERVYESKRQWERVLAALQELPPRCCQVFLLQRYEGWTYTAIAKHLGISASAVEKHMMRALLHLQARLTDR